LNLAAAAALWQRPPAEVDVVGRSGFCALLGAVVLTLACGHPPLTPPSQGGDPWVELDSKHFTLVSDLDEKAALRVIGGFEEIYAELGGAIFADAAVPLFHTDAVVFRQHQDARQFLGDDVGGVYASSLDNELEPRPTVIASGSLSPFARVLFAHELTHRFNHVALGPTPVWLNEGLAQYYSTIRAEVGKPVLGGTDPRYMCASGGVRQAVGDLICNYQVLKGSQLPRASELIDFDRSAFYSDEPDERGLLSWEQKQKRARHYGAAWLLVHLLMHEKLPYAERFREALGGAPSARKGELLEGIIQSVPEQDLDRDFAAYLQKTIPWREHHAGSPPGPEKLRRRALTESEVYLWWARLDSFVGDKAARARQHLDAAQQVSAAHDGRALFWLGRYSALRQQSQDAEKFYRRALEREQQNPEYLLGLLDLYWNDRRGQAWDDAARDPKVVALVDALSKSARTPRQHNAVAAHRLFSGEVEQALRNSGEACRLGPDCWVCFHNRAAALFAAGQAQEAARTQKEALLRLPENAARELAFALGQALGFYERALRDPESVASAPRPGLIAP
jgi:tetratricopeptide (TPR) repeat protein